MGKLRWMLFYCPWVRREVNWKWGREGDWTDPALEMDEDHERSFSPMHLHARSRDGLKQSSVTLLGILMTEIQECRDAFGLMVLAVCQRRL